MLAIRNPIDELTRGNFIAWLETKPPEEPYEYIDNENCLLGQFFKSRGFDNVIVFPYHINNMRGKWIDLPFVWNRIANGGFKGNTFGKALERARKLLSTVELEQV